MRCPHCGAITEVSEKRGAYRERRCSNPACRSEFTTCENPLTHSEHRRLNARALSRRGAREEIEADLEDVREPVRDLERLVQLAIGREHAAAVELNVACNENCAGFIATDGSTFSRTIMTRIDPSKSLYTVYFSDTDMPVFV